MRRIDVSNLLKGVENSKEIVDAILDMHNAELTEAKEKAVDLTKYVEKSKYDELEARLNKFKDYDELVKFKEDALKKELNVKKTDAVINLLKENNANQKAVKLLAKEFDIDSIELDENGKVKNADDLIKGVKENYADFFTQEETGGASPRNPVNNDSPSITKEAFKKMSLSERSKLASENIELYNSLKEWFIKKEEN